jgi:endonuclease YncB( thermonuclease family)
MVKWYLFIILLLFAYQSNAHAVTELVSIKMVTVMTQEKMVQTFLTNNSDIEQHFVYIIQLKDSNGHTSQIAWVEKSIRPNESLTVLQPFRIEMQDTYTVEIFIWSNVTDPVPLSSTSSSSTFDFFMPVIQCKGAAACFEGHINRIIDGDTMEVNGRRIRLALVDTPERAEAGYAEATRFTSSVCRGGIAFVDQDDKQMFDRYGRIIAIVYCDGALLNSELLFNEHAVIIKQFCKVSEFGDEGWAKLFGC